MMPDLTAAYDLVVSRLRALDITADIDPARVDAPGVWVKPAGVEFTLGDAFTLAELHCIVAANDLNSAMPDLDDLASEVVEELGRPDGDIRFASVTMPSGTPRPALVLPYRIA